MQEYLVFQVNEQQINWFSLSNGVYAALTADVAGIWRSRVFPGLWLAAAAFWLGDMPALMAVLQQGVASPEYVAFREQLLRR